MDEVHYFPVPKRFVPLIHRTLADAYGAESNTAATVDGSIVETPQEATDDNGISYEWTEEEVIRAYRESKPALRVIFDYLTDYAEDHSEEDPEAWVTAPDLARVAFPQADNAVNKLFGVFGGKSTRFHNTYRKHWFIDYGRERKPDGSYGSMIYRMPAKYVAWVKKARGSE